MNSIKVVNDTERVVNLTEDYNKIGPKNGEQKQYILQVVTEYRKEFSNCNKSILIK